MLHTVIVHKMVRKEKKYEIKPMLISWIVIEEVTYTLKNKRNNLLQQDY
jgi:hypothetical protein